MLPFNRFLSAPRQSRSGYHRNRTTIPIVTFFDALRHAIALVRAPHLWQFHVLRALTGLENTLYAVVLLLVL